MLDINWGIPNPVPRQQISILKNKPLHSLVDNNWQGQKRCKGMRTCKLMTTLTYMHPHHCNSSANVLKGLLHAKDETLCLGTAEKTILLLSIVSLNGEEGSPCTSIFKAALLSCAAFRWKNDRHSFWQQGQL